jgi:LmbE family N-acetylglucosaminyl deacetylase
VNVLAFFAHPDDETILAGGVLALLAESGAHVHVLCATRGEGGEVGEPPLCLPAELGAVREQELVCAVAALGGRSLTFLGYTDPRVGPDEQLYPFTEDLQMLTGQIALSIRQHRPQAVLTHGSNGEYGHPAHILAHRAALAAVLSFAEQAPLLYSVAASFEGHPIPLLANQDDPAHLVLDVTPVLARKEQAARCHRTQNALFVRRASQEAGRRLSVGEVLLRQEGLHRVHPPAGAGEVQDAFSARLRKLD